MRILLIGNFAPDRQESMLRFGRLLTGGLGEDGHDVTTWSPEPRLVRLLPRYRYSGASKLIGYVDKFLLFPRRVRQRLLRETQADVVHILDHANAVYAPLFAGRPLVATCHDLLQIRSAHGEFAQHRISPLGRRYQAWILDNIARLPHVIVPSHKTRADLQRLAGLTTDRISIVPLALNYPYRRVPSQTALWIVEKMLHDRNLPRGLLDHDGRGFVLNIGGGQWYKNRRGVVNIYAELRRRLDPPPRLLMIGKPLAEDLVARIHRLGLADDVIHLSNISEPELEALYSLAEGLLFPSWQEGFGWPVAEAQACGCPVFTSNREPMTEVGGDAAVYVDPANARSAAQTIVGAWPRRDDMRRRGLARAAEWDQRVMIGRYLETYHRVIANRAHAVAA